MDIDKSIVFIFKFIPLMNKEVETTLKDLIILSLIRFKTYKRALKLNHSPEIFKHQYEQSEKMLSEICKINIEISKEILREDNGIPLIFAWRIFNGQLNKSNDEFTLLKACINSEESVLYTYEMALNMDLPVKIKKIIEFQYRELTQSYRDLILINLKNEYKSLQVC